MASLQDIIFIFTSSFLALFPPVNPIGDGLIINRYLSPLQANEQKAVVKKIMYNCMLVGIASVICGHFVLMLFSLAVPVIQLGGGILICKTGFEGLSGSSEDKTENSGIEGTTVLDTLKSKIFYPLSFPICLGPGTISVIFTLMASTSNTPSDNFWVSTFIHYLIICLAVIAQCILIYICSIQGQKLTERLGESGTIIINKLISFLTFCIGIQIILKGVANIFHIRVL